MNTASQTFQLTNELKIALQVIQKALEYDHSLEILSVSVSLCRFVRAEFNSFECV